MKNKITVKGGSKQFTIPEEIMEHSQLKKAEILDAYSDPGSVVLLQRQLTAMQIVRTVDMLNTIATGLIMRLERAAMQHKERCRHIHVPEELLEMAGIPEGASLSINAAEGEVYITIAEDEEDLRETLPSFLRNLFEDCELDFAALRYLLESEAPVGE